MKDGYIKCGVATIPISIGNPFQNAEEIKKRICQAEKSGVKLLVFQELALSGYSCGDLFFQETLLNGCREALQWIVKETANTEVLSFIGLPYLDGNDLYDAVAVIQSGYVLGIIAKEKPMNQRGVNETRYFTPAPEKNKQVEFCSRQISLGKNLLMEYHGKIRIGCEIGAAYNSVTGLGEKLVLNGAQIIVNPAALPQFASERELRRKMVSAESRRLACGYVFANASAGESTTDVVYDGQGILSENGNLLEEAKPFAVDLTISEIDVSALNHIRRNRSDFMGESEEAVEKIPVHFTETETVLTRKYKKQPYLFSSNGSYTACLKEMFAVQVQGLIRRLSHISCKTVVLGLSGGLDSTLTILVAAKAFAVMGWNPKGILAVTMPCFGTTDRTYQNACTLAKELGATLKEISIKEAVTQHFKDISHKEEQHDITYENAQARERTQVIMDLANQENGIVLGTGDLSELALGWATYNGDLMSMYATNASIPKTVVRLLVEELAEQEEKTAIKQVLLDILATPVSPELLPPVNGVIAQKTENLVGPYELHDFFIYHMMVNGCAPKKILRLAEQTFAEEYTKETILQWLKTFYRRFFAQQFKRSCMPDGPKITEVSFSPRGSLCMPSDATVQLWMHELE